MHFKFILPRDGWSDHNYGTGDWARGQIKEVDDVRSKRLQGHPDVWEVVNVKAKPKDEIEVAPEPAKIPEEEYLDPPVVNLAMMDAAALRVWLESEFGERPDGRWGEERLRDFAAAKYRERIARGI